MEIDSPEIISLFKHEISTIANINQYAMYHLYEQPLLNVYIVPTQRSYEIIADKRCFRSVSKSKKEYGETTFKCTTKHCGSKLGVLVNEKNELKHIRMIEETHHNDCTEWNPTEAIFKQIAYQIQIECANDKQTRPREIYDKITRVYRKYFRENEGNVSIYMGDFCDFGQIRSNCYAQQSFSHSYSNPKDMNECIQNTISQVFGEDYEKGYHIKRNGNSLYIQKRYKGTKMLSDAKITCDDPTYDIVSKYKDRKKAQYQVNKFGAIYTNGDDRMEMFVCSYALLADKSAPTYNWQYQVAKDCCIADGFEMKTETHLGDFEKNKRRQYTAVNPNVKQPGEGFHLFQTWYRYMDSKCGLKMYHTYIKGNDLFCGKFVLICNKMEAMAYNPLKIKPKIWKNIKLRLRYWHRNRKWTKIESEQSVLAGLHQFMYYMDIYFMEQPLDSGKLHKNAFTMQEWHLEDKQSNNIMEIRHRWDCDRFGKGKSMVKLLLFIKEVLDEEEERYYRKIEMKRRLLNKRKKHIVTKYKKIAQSVKVLETFSSKTSIKKINAENDKIIEAINANKKSKYYLNKNQK